jgi:hypothetical protein
MFTTGWAAPRRRSASRTADVLALKSHNLDATIFGSAPQNFDDSGIANSARHHRFDDFGACYPEGTPIGKPSFRAKRKIAAWDDDFLASLMVA